MKAQEVQGGILMAKLIGVNFQMAEEVNIKGYREDIIIEKGIVITEDHAIKMEKLYQKYCEFFTALSRFIFGFD